MYTIQINLDELDKHAFCACAIWDTGVYSLMNYCGFMFSMLVQSGTQGYIH